MDVFRCIIDIRRRVSPEDMPRQKIRQVPAPSMFGVRVIIGLECLFYNLQAELGWHEIKRGMGVCWLRFYFRPIKMQTYKEELS